MASQVFDRILMNAERKGIVRDKSRESVQWFRRAASRIPVTAASPSRMLTGHDDASRFTNHVRIGSMYMYVYDPKTAASLPYFDRFPLVFPIGPAPHGFMGLNMHYLHPRMRAILFDRLQDDLLTNEKYDDSTRLRMTYKVLTSASKYKFFQPCLKHYLNKQVKSRFIYIHPSEWEMAMFLPTERFEKADKKVVWKDSTDAVT